MRTMLAASEWAEQCRMTSLIGLMALRLRHAKQRRHVDHDRAWWRADPYGSIIGARATSRLGRAVCVARPGLAALSVYVPGASLPARVRTSIWTRDASRSRNMRWK